MVFYQLVDNSPFERQWVRAISIRPQSHVVQWSCTTCGGAHEYPAGALDVILEDGSGFPDFLLCGAYPLFIVSERVLRAFHAAKIESFVEFPVGIAGIQESEANIAEAPKYYRLEVTGECRVDIVKSGGAVDRICERCFRLTTRPLLIRTVKLFSGSWDGTDLFRDHVLYPRVRFCTQRVADVIKAEKLTNASLKPQGELFTEESP